MAIMIPSHPQFSKNSYEDIIFDSLKKLPDNCFVLHSLSIYDPDLDGSQKKETEIDFLVIIPNLGCIVIEAKSGSVSFTDKTTYYNGEEIEPYTWIYGSGRPMKGNGPFRQSRDNMYAVISYLKQTNYSDLCSKQAFFNCVWFHQITKATVNSLPNRPECRKEQILTKEDLLNPMDSIQRIIKYQSKGIKIENKTPWTYDEASLLVSHVFAPSMNLIPGKNWEYEYKTEEMNKLLKDQENILNFLSEQPFAAISGAAGTGKTMIALKKAEIESSKGHKVLFLCYNNALADYLRDNYKREGIDFYNISQFACKMCKSNNPDYGALANMLDTMVNNNSFIYDTIIVDEAQDFGQEVTDNSEINILEKLYDYMILLEGTLYVFYDKNQVVNSNKLPSFIVNADCKLTLFANCRNTKKIATTSLKPLRQKSNSWHNCIDGETPKLILVNESSSLNVLKKTINSAVTKYKNLVVLTAKSINSSQFFTLADKHSINIDGRKYPFYSCRQYKGLEADAIVLVDVDASNFSNDKDILLFYVGASRAKFSLSILANLTSEECEKISRERLEGSFIEGFDYNKLLAMWIGTDMEKFN